MDWRVQRPHSPPDQTRRPDLRRTGSNMSIQASTQSATAAANAAALADGGPSTSGLSQFISFAIGDEQYGVDIMAVREIKGWSEITHLPKQPDYMRGVLNLRGAMVPIIDLRCRFAQGMTEAAALHIIIVVQIGAPMVGLLADRVLDIVSVELAQVQPVPRVAAAAHRDFLSGLVTIESGMIALIDLSHMLAVPGDEAAAAARAA